MFEVLDNGLIIASSYLPKAKLPEVFRSTSLALGCMSYGLSVSSAIARGNKARCIATHAARLSSGEVAHNSRTLMAVRDAQRLCKGFLRERFHCQVIIQPEHLLPPDDSAGQPTLLAAV